jgi:hypothetical protein
MNPPDGKIFKFDKGQYERLISFLTSDETTLSQQVMIQPNSEVDFTDPRFLPGSTNWHPAAHLAEKAKALSTSIFDRLGEVDTEYTNFADALAEAKKVFEDTDDLAHYSATQFTEKFPDVAGGGPGTGTGNNSGS